MATSIANRSPVNGMPEKASILKKKIIMAMFINVLVITIVAKSFLGLDSSDVMSEPFLGLLVFIVSRSKGVSENNATSVPDINAEQNSRNTMAAKPVTRL